MRLISCTLFAVLVLALSSQHLSRLALAQGQTPDTLVAARVAQIPERLRVAIQADYDTSSRTAYTLAVGTTGQGWGSHSGRGTWSLREQTRVAQQRCEHLSQGPCILVMVAGRLTGSVTPEPRALTYLSHFNAATVPFLNDASRADLALRYPTAQQHRALALTRTGDYHWVSQQTTEAAAQRDALLRCQQGGGGNRPCFVYSVNDQVVFTSQTDISDAIRPQR